MKDQFPVYVAYIGVKSITLGGSSCLQFSLKDAEYRRGFTVNRFSSEDDVNKFLQTLINNQIPFANDTKSNAYSEICQLKIARKVLGEIKHR